MVKKDICIVHYKPLKRMNGWFFNLRNYLRGIKYDPLVELKLYDSTEEQAIEKMRLIALRMVENVSNKVYSKIVFHVGGIVISLLSYLIWVIQLYMRDDLTVSVLIYPTIIVFVVMFVFDKFIEYNFKTFDILEEHIDSIDDNIEIVDKEIKETLGI